jgi:hypothetical protein
MASGQESREELARMAEEGQTVVPGGTGGKTLEAQEHLAEGLYPTAGRPCDPLIFLSLVCAINPLLLRVSSQEELIIN